MCSGVWYGCGVGVYLYCLVLFVVLWGGVFVWFGIEGMLCLLCGVCRRVIVEFGCVFVYWLVVGIGVGWMYVDFGIVGKFVWLFGYVCLILFLFVFCLMLVRLFVFL